MSSKDAVLFDAAWSVLAPIADKYGIKDSVEFARRLTRTSAPAGPEKSITIAEAADRLKVTPHTIRAWQKDGRLPRIAINRKVIRVPEAAINAILGGSS